jgi:hypothetical protein
MSTDTAPEKRFLKPTLTPITSKPNHQTLSALEQELNSNAISVQSTRGGRAHSHLILTISATKYLAITGVPFAAIRLTLAAKLAEEMFSDWLCANRLAHHLTQLGHLTSNLKVVAKTVKSRIRLAGALELNASRN